MKQKLVMLVGLPASGKSTKAKEMCEKEGYVRINKDDLRSMLFNSYNQKKEKYIIKARNLLLESMLEAGKNVVVDDTNLNPVHEAYFKQVAKQYNVEFMRDDSFLQVPVEECIKRDLKRLNSVGERVIWDMYYKWVNPINAETKDYNPNLPYCVLCDIDGTLAHMEGRSPYDWNKVDTDKVDSAVAYILDSIKFMMNTSNRNGRPYNNNRVILLSGRDSICREKTRDWLELNDIDYDRLYMRKEGDNRSDVIVKRELYEKHIKGKYNVLCVIDDRPVVCRSWRELGLKVLQVGNPYYEF